MDLSLTEGVLDDLDPDRFSVLGMVGQGVRSAHGWIDRPADSARALATGSSMDSSYGAPPRASKQPSSAIQTGHGHPLHFPVIKDTGSFGRTGDVMQPDLDGRAELKGVAHDCRTAWSDLARSAGHSFPWRHEIGDG